jgi:origin recognition complex subunit 1
MSTTPRRSNRLSRNPLVPRNPHPNSTSESYHWISDPIHSRPSIRDDFLDDDEWVQARGDEDEDDEDENAERRSVMTDFYDGFAVSGKKTVGKFSRFTRGAKKGRPKNLKGKGKGKGKDEEDLYKIGDTVLVTSVNRLPSVGVIVGMWENRWEDEEGEETQKMRVKIHWFLRPTELAGIRAKREHAVVRTCSLVLF